MKRILFASLLIFCAALGFGQASQNNFLSSNGSTGAAISGTPTANQIALWASGLAIQGNTNFTFDGTTFNTPNVNAGGTAEGRLQLTQGPNQYPGTNTWELIADPLINNSIQVKPWNAIFTGLVAAVAATAPSIGVTTTGSAPNKTITNFTGFPTGLYPAGFTPICLVQDATGTGASVTAVMVANQINSFTVNSFGNGNFTAPTVSCVGNTAAGLQALQQATAHHVSASLDCTAASGSGTAYTCTTNPSFTPGDGDIIFFEADVASGVAPTLVVNGQAGTPAINKQGGGTAIGTNDLLAGQHCPMEFDNTNWQMLCQVGNAPVTSVFTRTGAVTANPGDYTAAQVTNAVANNAANTAGTGMTLDMSAATGANAFRGPVQAGFTCSSVGAFGYDSTALNTHICINGADAIAVGYTGGLTLNTIPKSGNGTKAIQQNSSIVDNGTTIKSAESAKFGNSVILTADTSGITATTAATAVTVFTLPTLQINTNYALHCSGTTTQATAGAGIGIAIQTATTAATNMELHALVNTSATAINGQSSGPLSTTTESAVYTGVTGTVTTQLPWSIDGSIEIGATLPTSIVIGFFSISASDAVVVKRDSSCTVLP
jgi:hypothetical protein